jgi:hypothetical protein
MADGASRLSPNRPDVVGKATLGAALGYDDGRAKKREGGEFEVEFNVMDGARVGWNRSCGVPSTAFAPFDRLSPPAASCHANTPTMAATTSKKSVPTTFCRCNNDGGARSFSSSSCSCFTSSINGSSPHEDAISSCVSREISSSSPVIMMID